MGQGKDKAEYNPKEDQKNSKNPKILNREVFYKGKDIVRQGEDGVRAYFIESGHAEVLIKEGPHELKVAELEEGDIFGEMALINHEPRSATVRAVEDCTVTVIARDELEKKIDNIEDKAIKALINALAERLKESTRGQMDHYRNLADFQDRISGVVDRVDMGIDKSQRNAFREEVTPLLADLQKVLDRYQ